MSYIASESAHTAGSGVFVDTFTDGPDYTAGTSSQVTLSQAPATLNSMWVFFNGIVQHHSEYSVNGTVVSFTSIIPANVSTIEVQVNIALAVGVPAPASVEYSTLTSNASTTLQRKNAVINGNFDIWQRGTSHSTIGYGSADRWTLYFAGTSATCTLSQQAFALGQTVVLNEPTYFARHAVVSGTDIATDIKTRHQIEGVRTFAGETITLSFYAKANSVLDMTPEFTQAFGTGGAPSATVGVPSQKVSLTTAWQKYELTYDIPSISGKTIGTDNNSYLQLNIWFSAGSNADVRSDTLGIQTGTFDIAQVQVEKGITATEFERRSYSEELAMCQRYYATGFVNFRMGSYVAGMIAHSTFQFPVTMRVTPTATQTTTGTLNWTLGANTTVESNSGMALDLRATAINSGGYYYYDWTADAEF